MHNSEAARLFNLRGVPDDELEEVRSLLSEHRIDFYETPAGNWGISSPAIWVREAGDLEAARELLDEYQRGRAARSRSEWERQCREGRAESLIARIKREPGRALLYLGVIAVVLYVSIKPFLLL